MPKDSQTTFQKIWNWPPESLRKRWWFKAIALAAAGCGVYYMIEALNNTQPQVVELPACESKLAYEAVKGALEDNGIKLFGLKEIETIPQQDFSQSYMPERMRESMVVEEYVMCRGQFYTNRGQSSNTYKFTWMDKASGQYYVEAFGVW